MKNRIAVLCVLMALCLLSSCGIASSRGRILVNVSYDPTREFYEAYNELFRAHWLETTGEPVDIGQSHGGSGSQARSVLEGADADVVTLALAHDISLLEEDGMIRPGWERELPLDSAPYTSAIVFLVRSGNPKDIRDWDDLIRPDMDVITPDPKSSGGACWNFLAAWRYAERSFGPEDMDGIKAFMAALYGNVLVMDSGARGATTTFVENGQGDVLVAWENEALMALYSYPGEFELVTPSVSILAQPSVAVVDENAERDGVSDLAEAYLAFLYEPEAQRLAGQYGYRPTDPRILEEFSDVFDLDVELCTVSDFGGWDAAYQVFFRDGGVFDEIYTG